MAITVPRNWELVDKGNGRGDMPDASVAVGTSWVNVPIADQLSSPTEPFTLNFDVEARQDNPNLVVGVSDGPVGAYSEVAAIVRMSSTTSEFDAYNLNGYFAANEYPFVVGVEHKVQMSINPADRTYTATVDGVVVALNYQFRSTAVVAELNNVAAIQTGSDSSSRLADIRAATLVNPYTVPATILTPDGSSYAVSPSPAGVFFGRTGIVDPNDTWGILSAPAGLTVTPLPGGDYTVEVAPGTSPGTYTFEWQRYINALNIFEDGSKSVTVA